MASIQISCARAVGASSAVVRKAEGVPDPGSQVDAAQSDEKRLGKAVIGHSLGEKAAKGHAGGKHNCRGYDFAGDKAGRHAEELHKSHDDEICLMAFMRLERCPAAPRREQVGGGAKCVYEKGDLYLRKDFADRRPPGHRRLGFPRTRGGRDVFACVCHGAMLLALFSITRNLPRVGSGGRRTPLRGNRSDHRVLTATSKVPSGNNGNQRPGDQPATRTTSFIVSAWMSAVMFAPKHPSRSCSAFSACRGTPRRRNGLPRRILP